MKTRKAMALGAFALALCAGVSAQGTCENGSPEVGAAGICSVFELATGKISMSHGDPTGVDGNVCVASGGELSMSGGQIITGAALLEPGAEYPDDIEERAGSVDFTADLSVEIQAALDASAALAALPCDTTVDRLKIEESSVIDVRDFKPAGGQAVICVDGDMEVKGSGTTLLMMGQPGDSLVFNVGGALKANGAKGFAAGGLTPSDIVYNLAGSGKDVAFSGGGGGVGCCKAELDGTILAPDRKVALSPGKVNGQVISGRDISLASGSLVVCPEVDEPLGSIGDRVWEDSFTSGTVGEQDPGEGGLNGVTVSLFDAAMNLVASVETSGDGNYLFADLPAGTYTVTVDPNDVPGLFPTFDFDGAATQHTATVALAAGEDNLLVDFGYAPLR